MREAESKSWEKEVEQEWERETVKILGIWGFLFVLICDYFVVNFSNRICSLSCWILVCLEDNDVCGAKYFGNSGPFHIKRKAHVKEKEMSEDEQRRSELPGDFADDNFVLGKPKSWKEKVARHQG